MNTETEALSVPPYQPESLERLKSRFAAALSPDYCTDGFQAPPGLLRQHVFDFDNGIRMIVSHDIENGRRTLHFSFSINPIIRAKNLMSREEFRAFAEQAIREFWHPPVVVEDYWSYKALHFWCQPD